MISKQIFFFLFIVSSCSLTGLGQGAGHSPFLQADSFFMNRNYQQAKMLYTKLLGDTSRDALHLNRLGFSEYSTGNYERAEDYLKKALALHPSGLLKASILSRLARISAWHNNEKESMDYIDSAISNGYLAVKELDTVKDFSVVRDRERFKQLRDRIFNSLYPCVNDARAKEFDFWIGEWNVYVTGTNIYAGHSLIQKVSGGCALLENWNSSASEGKSLNYIDDSTKKWKQVWIGSYPAGKQDFVDGQYKDSVMVFKFTATGANGNRLAGRFSFFNQGANQVRQLNETSADAGKTWAVSYDYTYKRKN